MASSLLTSSATELIGSPAGNTLVWSLAYHQFTQLMGDYADFRVTIRAHKQQMGIEIENCYHACIMRHGAEHNQCKEWKDMLIDMGRFKF